MSGFAASLILLFKLASAFFSHASLSSLVAMFVSMSCCIARMSLIIASRRLQCLFILTSHGTAFPAPLGERGKGREGVLTASTFLDTYCAR